MLLLGAVGLLLALVGPSLGAALLIIEGRPVGPYLQAMKDWILNVVVGSAALLFAAIARRQGATQRNQQVASANQFATAQRVDVIAAHVQKLDERHELLAGTVAEAARTVASLRERGNDEAAGARVAAAVEHLERLLDFAGRTGPLAVVAPAAPSPPEPARAPTAAPLGAVERTERHAETLPPLRPLPPAASAPGQLRPATGPVAAAAPAPEPEQDAISVWGPAGRPAWAVTGENPASGESATDALAALLGRPRRRDAEPASTSSILRAVQALEDDVTRPEDPRRRY